MQLRSVFTDMQGSPSLLPKDVVDSMSDVLEHFALDGWLSPQPTEHSGVMHDPCSPCARPVRQQEGVLADPGSPSAQEGISALALSLFAERDTSTDRQGSQMSIPMKKATCQRASRAARANDPSSEATMRAYNIMYNRFQTIKKDGIERAPWEVQAFKSFKPASGSGGKGAAVRTSQHHQSKMNHLASIKAKDVDTNNTEPAFLLGGFTSPMLWDRLAENSLKSNAVNSSVSISSAHVFVTLLWHADAFTLCLQVMNRKKTQGAANQ